MILESLFPIHLAEDPDELEGMLFGYHSMIPGFFRQGTKFVCLKEPIAGFKFYWNVLLLAPDGRIFVSDRGMFAPSLAP